MSGRTGLEKEGDAGVEVDEHGDEGQRGSTASSYELKGARPLLHSGASCKACYVLAWKRTYLRTCSVVLTEHQTLNSL